MELRCMGASFVARARKNPQKTNSFDIYNRPGEYPGMEQEQFIQSLDQLPWSSHSRIIRTGMVRPGELKTDVCAWVTDIDQQTLSQVKEHRDALRSLRVFPLVISGIPSLTSLDDPKTLLRTYQGMTMSRAATSDERIIAPDGKEYLPFQRAGIVYARGRMGTLFGDEMGLGKTIQAIGVCNDRNIKDILVVCPAYLKLNWKREIEQWRIGNVDTVILYGKSGVPDLSPVERKSRFIIINYDILHRFTNALSSHEFGALILDEAHCIKNLETKRTQAVFEIKARVKLALTGTPALNRPFELYPLVKLLMPRPMSKDAFGKKFCGSGGRGSIDFRGSSNPVALQQLLRQNIMIRRLKKDVLKELPPKRRQVIELPPPSEMKMTLDLEAETWGPHEEVLLSIKHQMDEAEMAEDDEAFMKLAGQFGTKMAIAFTEMAKIRVELSMSKIHFIAPHCREFLMGGDEKLIVFFYHKEAAGKLCEMLSDFGSKLITGDVKMADRDAAVQAFQNDPSCRVIIGTIGAMGTGVTLTASSTVIMAELDWRPGILAQAEDRAHRIGQLESVLCQYFVFEDSVDSKMVFDIISKMSVLYRVLDSTSTTNDVLETPRGEGAPKSKRKRKIIKVEKEKHDLVLGALKAIAANNRDMARQTNGVGFSKFDNYAGMRLSALESLQRGELSFAANLVWKYRKQVDPIVIRDIWPNGIE